MVEQYGALNAYGHLGFWGTCFFYIPELKTSIAVYILEKEKRKLYRDIIVQIIQIIQMQASFQENCSGLSYWLLQDIA